MIIDIVSLVIEWLDGIVVSRVLVGEFDAVFAVMCSTTAEMSLTIGTATLVTALPILLVVGLISGQGTRLGLDVSTMGGVDFVRLPKDVGAEPPLAATLKIRIRPYSNVFHERLDTHRLLVIGIALETTLTLILVGPGMQYHPPVQSAQAHP